MPCGLLVLCYAMLCHALLGAAAFLREHPLGADELSKAIIGTIGGTPPPPLRPPRRALAAPFLAAPSLREAGAPHTHHAHTHTHTHTDTRTSTHPPAAPRSDRLADERRPEGLRLDGAPPARRRPY